MPDWAALFTTDTPLLELLLRGTIMFFALLLLMRFVGQREAGGLGMTDLLVIVLVGGALGDGMTGGGVQMADGLIPVAVVMFWSATMDALTYRWPALSSLLKGRAKPLIKDGRLDRRVMRRELISMDELNSQLREHELEDISQVHRAHLEPNGDISIVPLADADASKS